LAATFTVPGSAGFGDSVSPARHTNVSTTATYYIKTAADDVRKAMTTLENSIAEAGATQQDTIGTPSGDPDVNPSTVQ